MKEKKEESGSNLGKERVSESKSQDSGGTEHGECCEECKKTCKRNFWTQVLRTITKIGTGIMAAFGLSSFVQDD